MAPSYLTRSALAWLSVALIVGGFALKFLASSLGWPVWMIPVGYFTAMVGATVLFWGWVLWKIRG